MVGRASKQDIPKVRDSVTDSRVLGRGKRQRKENIEALSEVNEGSVLSSARPVEVGEIQRRTRSVGYKVSKLESASSADEERAQVELELDQAEKTILTTNSREEFMKSSRLFVNLIRRKVGLPELI